MSSRETNLFYQDGTIKLTLEECRKVLGEHVEWPEVRERMDELKAALSAPAKPTPKKGVSLVAPPALDPSRWTPHARREALRAKLEVAAVAFAEAAPIFMAMKKAGDDVSWLSPVMRRILHDIARGRVLPKVATVFDGRLRQRLMQLPVAVQQQALDGGTFPVVSASGETIPRKAQDLVPAEIDQIFPPGKIRTESEQREWLAQKPAAKPRCEADPVRDGLWFRTCGFFGRAEILALLDELDKRAAPVSEGGSS